MQKLARIALITALAAAGFGCDQQPAASAGPAGASPAAVAAPAATPDAAVAMAVKALRDNNIAALFAASLPAGEYAKLKTDWNKDINSEPVTEEDRKDFAEKMSKLTAPGAEDKMFAEIKPQLDEFDKQSAQQMPMMIAMGQGFAQSAIQQNKDLTDAQKQQVTQLLDATAKWAQNTKFTDPALVKSAIGVICKTARDLNLKTVDEARALSYEQGMQKAGIVLGGVKQVLAVYGLNMDKALDSVKVETVSANGDAAKVKISYTAFETPFSTESDLVRVDGKWYGKDAIEKWKKHSQEIAAAAPATAPAQAPAEGAK
jgi:hypothetical protein